MADVDAYMRDKFVPSNIQKVVLKQVKHRETHESSAGEAMILDSLPLHLTRQIISLHYGSVLKTIYVFDYIDDVNEILYIFPKLNSAFYSPGDIMIQQNTMATELVFLATGIVTIRKQWFVPFLRKKKAATFQKLSKLVDFKTMNTKKSVIKSITDKVRNLKTFSGKKDSDIKRMPTRSNFYSRKIITKGDAKGIFKEANLNTCSAPSVFGLVSLITGKPHRASAVCDVPCSTYSLSEKSMIEMSVEAPSVALSLREAFVCLYLNESLKNHKKRRVERSDFLIALNSTFQADETTKSASAKIKISKRRGSVENRGSPIARFRKMALNSGLTSPIDLSPGSARRGFNNVINALKKRPPVEPESHNDASAFSARIPRNDVNIERSNSGKISLGYIEKSKSRKNIMSKSSSKSILPVDDSEIEQLPQIISLDNNIENKNEHASESKGDDFDRSVKRNNNFISHAAESSKVVDSTDDVENLNEIENVDSKFAVEPKRIAKEGLNKITASLSIITDDSLPPISTKMNDNYVAPIENLLDNKTEESIDGIQKVSDSDLFGLDSKLDSKIVSREFKQDETSVVTTALSKTSFSENDLGMRQYSDGSLKVPKRSLAAVVRGRSFKELKAKSVESLSVTPSQEAKISLNSSVGRDSIKTVSAFKTTVTRKPADDKGRRRSSIAQAAQALKKKKVFSVEKLDWNYYNSDDDEDIQLFKAFKGFTRDDFIRRVKSEDDLTQQVAQKPKYVSVAARKRRVTFPSDDVDNWKQSSARNMMI